LEFDVSARLTEGERLQLRAGDDVLPWVVIDEGADDVRKPARIRVNLPQARLGEFELTATFPVALDRPASPASTAASIPLLIPIDGELIDNELRLVPDDEIVVQHVDEAWAATTAAADAGRRRITTYHAGAPRSEVAVGLRWEQSVRARELFVERAWIQTVQLGAARWERAVFRIATRAPFATVRLPAQAAMPATFVDGHRLDAVERGAGGTVIFNLPVTADDVHVIDLRYQVPATAADGPLVAPTIVEATSYGQAYRQLVFPADTVLWRASGEFAAEYEWQRRGLFWLRTPRMTQAQLEQWCGATAEPPLPEGANVYLFSTYGEASPLIDFTIRRSTLVLMSSAAVLAAALAFLYVAALRRPGTMLTVAVMVGGLGFAFPETVPVALQASMIGVVLAFIAMLIERNIARRQGRVARTIVESVSVGPRGSTRTRLVPSSVPSSPSTPTSAEMPSPSAAAGGAG